MLTRFAWETSSIVAGIAILLVVFGTPRERLLTLGLVAFWVAACAVLAAMGAP